jgi:hypothetical protein
VTVPSVVGATRFDDGAAELADSKFMPAGSGVAADLSPLPARRRQSDYGEHGRQILPRQITETSHDKWNDDAIAEELPEELQEEWSRYELDEQTHNPEVSGYTLNIISHE